MKLDLTKGNITKNLLLFTMPLIAGNIFQQFYNIADTWIVGRFIGAKALAAVGSSYTLMVFLTSIFIGLCMGSGALYSIYFGKRDFEKLKKSIGISFVFTCIITLALNIFVFLCFDWIIDVFQVPADIMPLMKEYLQTVFLGLMAVFVYNYFAYLLRSIGNSATPLVFLAVSVILNIILDLFFVIYCDMGVKGAAFATVISQFIAGAGIMIYTWSKFPELRIGKEHFKFDKTIFSQLANLSLTTCLQQSVMNFGILMVQGLVNSFGASVMAAFAAAVKIDTVAYMPVQDFGNGFSTYIAQNYGAAQKERIKKGMKKAVMLSMGFCIIISIIVCFFAENLMMIFVKPEEIEIINIGVQYLIIEGACYAAIGILFLLYGFYRGISKPKMSLVLTIISLGSRVLLAYSSAGVIGVTGIWAAVPIGWILADVTGIMYYRKNRNKILDNISV